MSTTINLSAQTLCQYKSGTLGPYTLTESNTQVTGSIHWTHKNGKIAFYFKATSRLANSYYNSSKGYIWYGNQGGKVRLTVGSSNSGWRLFVRQNSASQVTGYSAGGYQSSPGTYDTTSTVTVNATTSALSLKVELSSSSTVSKSVSFTPSVNTMVTTTPSIEYYRDGANVLARVKCVTTRSSTAYSDSYTYAATITVAGVSQSVTLTIPSTNTSATNTSAWVTVQSTANTLSASVRIASTNGGAFSGTQTATLNVPAMSTLSGASTGTLGTDYTIGITRYDASFVDSISYYINGTLIGTIATGLTGSTASYIWSVPPVDLASYAPTANTVVVTIRCTTVSGTTTIGSTDLSVTMTIPSSVIPDIGTVTLTKVNENATVNSWDVYLQGYSKCKVDIVGSSSMYGATIVSQYAKLGSVPIEGSGDNTNWSGTSGIITASGNVTVYVGVTDSRGRIVEQAFIFSVYEYSAPTIANASVYRAGASGTTELDDGTYIYAYAKAVFSSAGNKNSATMSVKYRPGTSGSYTTGGTLASETGTKFGNGSISVSTPWEVVITITDALGNSNEYTFQLSTGAASIHIRPGGTGICFGGYSQNDDSVALANGMAFLAGDSVIRTSLPATGIEGQIVMLISAGTLVPYIYANGTWISTLLSAYPIGSIYMSTVSTNPGTLFGGTWAQLEDRFLLTAGSTYTAGDTGGEATHLLTADESGQRALTITGGGHSHTITTRYQKVFAAGTNKDGYWGNGSSNNTSMAYTSTDGSHTHSVSAASASQAHNNMPPYLVVYAWERTA